ncbi:S1-like domain-containing RNA-binding protein [Geomonas sp. RF6]|uniref:CvfB family protein n=1 Tax=Geomonas sp. RF6 TaxID=2897342 RepID=UPI001E40D41B|nr:S1-like domain-containing RNA-binding protein [Geomonas sp. RF6]UFS70004.1 S1-like domain-containing RNA-binding protein [Geomonas sp. RF6]
MLEIGKFNQLEVRRLSQIGAYLGSDLGEILLPNKYLAPGVHPGDVVSVFVYLDSEDRLVATTQVPKAQVGDFAVLEVKQISKVGAFLDWGLEKDLLVPFGEQPRPMQKGERHLVRVYLDRSERIAASAKIAKFLEPRTTALTSGQEVELIIYDFTELGAKVIIDGRYSGLLFKSDLFGRPAVGEKLKGYVTKVREDGKVDVSLRKTGLQETDRAKDVLLAALRDAGGFLPVGDKTPPQEIAELLQISKKSFKKVLGNLYKDGMVDITEDGVKLRS